MKNILVKSFVGLLTVLMLGLVAFAQTPKRIDFAKEGSNALVWEEKVAANSSKSFVFYAKKGQKLSLSMVDDTNQGSMDLGKVSIEPNADPYEMEIEVSKDYILSVSNNSKKATSFRISVSLEDAQEEDTAGNSEDSSSDEETIKFARGANSANLKGIIKAGSQKTFMFNARKGQTLRFTVNDETNKLKVDFNKYPRKLGVEVRQVLNASGDWAIYVDNPSNKPVNYTLWIEIK